MVTAAIAGLPRWAATGAGLRGHGRVAAGAALLALAFFCKQTGIIYVALGGLIVLVVAWRRVVTYVAVAGVIGLGGTWLLQTTTHGWFWIYVRKIHAAHDFNMDRFWKSLGNILWHVPALTIVVGARARAGAGDRDRRKRVAAARDPPAAAVVGDVRGVDADRHGRLGHRVRALQRVHAGAAPRRARRRRGRARGVRVHQAVVGRPPALGAASRRSPRSPPRSRSPTAATPSGGTRARSCRPPATSPPATP